MSQCSCFTSPFFPQGSSDSPSIWIPKVSPQRGSRILSHSHSPHDPDLLTLPLNSYQIWPLVSIPMVQPSLPLTCYGLLTHALILLSSTLALPPPPGGMGVLFRSQPRSCYCLCLVNLPKACCLHVYHGANDVYLEGLQGK